MNHPLSQNQEPYASQCSTATKEMRRIEEGFRPVSNTRDNSLVGRLKFYGRMTLDLQILTIYREMKKILPGLSGSVLDVGCGQSPYRFLLDEKGTRYFGIDIDDAEKFDYQNREITPFNGREIPFSDETFDAVICTEVLEHVFHHQELVSEIYRVMKPQGEAIITIPWSARYHYIPHDYFRYTPSALREIFGRFASVTVLHRGTDIAVIANKLIVLWFRNMLPAKRWKLVFLPVWVGLSPILACIVAVAHLSLRYDLGSTDDPLGYTIRLRK